MCSVYMLYRLVTVSVFRIQCWLLCINNKSNIVGGKKSQSSDYLVFPSASSAQLIHQQSRSETLYAARPARRQVGRGGVTETLGFLSL